MTKATTKSAAKAVSFIIGNRVIAQTAATLQEPATGTIVDISKSGWYIIELDETNAPNIMTNTKGKISARQSSIQLITEVPKAPASSTLGMLQAANATEAPKAPKNAPKAAPKPHWPGECPECGSTELTADDESCTCDSCGWTEVAGDEDGEGKDEHPMAKALRLARQHYAKTTRPDGSKSADCGDAIATELRDYEPLEVAALADRVLKVAPGTHEGKYSHLNPGQIRMNSGNRIRAEWKRANEEGDEEAILHVAKLLNLIEVDDDAE